MRPTTARVIIECLRDDGGKEEEERSVLKANTSTVAAKKLIVGVGSFSADGGDILVSVIQW